MHSLSGVIYTPIISLPHYYVIIYTYNPETQKGTEIGKMSRYVIVDLEMCMIPACNRTPNRILKNELIQIGAVLLDEDLEVAETYMSYVSPEFGAIDPFIQRLTGITRSDTANAPNAADALSDFVEWLPDDAVLVSWSKSDEQQIRNEIKCKSIHVPGLDKYLDTWIDCQETFGEKMDTARTYKLSEALIISGIDYIDGEHDALVDARNTAMLFAKMEREPEFQLSPFYFGSSDNVPSNNPFAALLGKISFSD